LKKIRGTQFPLTQFIAIVVISVSVFLAVDFARRTAAIYRIKNEAVRLEEEVASVHAQGQALEARLQYVQSDAYVEEIARTQLNWALPEETAVVVMATPQAVAALSPDEQNVETGTPQIEEPWQAWWILFFELPLPDSLN
jgi:cell division protein FtsB